MWTTAVRDGPSNLALMQPLANKDWTDMGQDTRRAQLWISINRSFTESKLHRYKMPSAELPLLRATVIGI